MFIREFNYFFFQPISFEQFYNAFKTEYNFQSAESAKRIYNDWIMFFSHRAGLFYRSQYSYHQSIMEKGFSIEQQIPEGHSFSEYGLDEHWEYYSRENGLTAHYYEHESQLSTIHSLDEWARLENNTPTIHTMSDLAQDFETTRNEIALRQRPTTKAINELWFNSTIKNSDDIISQLRKIPYPEYLKTKHWQRIRAAMLLIHKASCQAEGHYEQFESWYFGWEPEIDVHHITYVNKGNERYSDLVLLCKDHHKIWHANASEGKQQIEIFDENWR